MPLVTNRCEKHGHAHPEVECPYCKFENLEHLLGASKEFFRKFGGVIVLAPTFPKGEKVTVEDVFQHFRIRILEEIGTDRKN